MEVLYKGLTSFEQFTNYIERNELHVIASNVAISCAVHDQNLDETMNISGKTTTNISPKDFCKNDKLGSRFQGNTDNFNQYEALCSLKLHLPKYQGVYHQLSNEESKNTFLNLLLFWLCPYTTKFFEGLLHKSTPDLEFKDEVAKKLKEATGELENLKEPVHFSIASSLTDFVEIPQLLSDLNPNHQYHLSIYQNDEDEFLPILSVSPQSAKKSGKKKTLDLIPAEVTEKVVNTATPDSSELDELLSMLDNLPEAKPQEAKPQEAKPQEAKPQEAKPQEAKPIMSQLADLFPEEMVPSKKEEAKASEEIADLMTLLDSMGETERKTLLPHNPLDPNLLPPNTIPVDIDCMNRSLELLDTMEELVNYLQKEYPVEDKVCKDLLGDMMSGVTSIRAVLEYRREDNPNLKAIAEKYFNNPPQN